MPSPPLRAGIRALVVMGVSGSGKSTIAARLAERLGWRYEEADGYHSPANVAKMAAGTPLTDADRWPWLDALADAIDAARTEGGHCVLACSALRRAYRERLTRGHADVRFVFLEGDFPTVAGRLSGRSGHYMPASLLESQYATLEPPGADERAIVVPIDASPDAIVDRVLAQVLAAS